MWQKILSVINLLASLLGFNENLTIPPSSHDPFISPPVVEIKIELSEPPKVDEVDFPIVEQATTTQKTTSVDPACYCVTVARNESLKSIPLGTDADELKPNSTPDVGNGILFDYNGVRHVAVIKDIMSEGWWVKEGNKEKCKITERLVYYNDPFIVGFIKA